MVLQDKYKAKASRTWKASRGLSTAAKPSTRRPPPPSVNDEAEFPELQRQTSSNSSGSGSDSSVDAQDGTHSVGGVATASSSSSNTAKQPQHPKFSRRRLVNNSTRYDEPDNEGVEGHSSNDEHDLSSFMMKSANVDDNVDQYTTQRTVTIDDDDIDHDLANRHQHKERQVLQMDTESTKELEEMHKDRVNAEAAWNLKSRLRGESGRQYIQRYESSKKSMDQINDNDFFESIDNASADIEARISNMSGGLISQDSVSSTVTPQNITKDQDFLDDLI